MEKENSLCSKVLNNTKWGSTALVENRVGRCGSEGKKIMSVLRRLLFR